MRVYRGSEATPRSERGCVLTIGNFDGVHVGHQELLRTVIERAHGRGLRAAVYTFHPHPRRVLRPDQADPLLMTWGQLEAELARRGVDVLIQEPFTLEFASLDAEAFLRQIIFERIAPEELFVGRDFHFGKGRSGGGETLAELGPELGIKVAIIPQVREGGSDVSSSRIRAALRDGHVEEARRCLGRPYSIYGRVVLGDQRGRALGFPTANLESENEIAPKRGVYATSVRLLARGGDPEAGVPRAAVTNIGTRPTFEPGETVIETHLLDYEGDLYDRRLELRFHQRLREEKRFPGPDELVEQIARDTELARIAHASELEP
jgi:riboflavin kinase/FMN adenylyltransferase